VGSGFFWKLEWIFECGIATVRYVAEALRIGMERKHQLLSSPHHQSTVDLSQSPSLISCGSPRIKAS
jgi:hypothetical protein